MFKLEEYIDKSKEELHGAKEYAIKYVECKARNDNKCSKYKDMAEQELQHSKNFYDFAVQEMEVLSRNEVPAELQEKMQELDKCYAEKSGTIKYMLSL